MFSILLPLDGSPFAERAVSHAVALARSLNGQITLLRVVAPTEFRNDVDFSQVDWRLKKVQASAYLTGIAEQIRKTGIPVDTRVEEGSPATVILATTRDRGIQVLVLCTHGRGAAFDFPHGSVTSKLLAAFTGSVLLVGANTPDVEPANRGYQQLAVPIDGSYEADCSLKLAAKLAENNEAELAIACIARVPQLPSIVRHDYRALSLVDELSGIVQSAASQKLAEVRAQLPANISVHTAVIRSDLGDHPVCKVMKRFKSDLLVVSRNLIDVVHGPVPTHLPMLVLSPADIAANATRRPTGPIPETRVPIVDHQDSGRAAVDGVT